MCVLGDESGNECRVLGMGAVALAGQRRDGRVGHSRGHGTGPLAEVSRAVGSRQEEGGGLDGPVRLHAAPQLIDRVHVVDLAGDELLEVRRESGRGTGDEREECRDLHSLGEEAPGFAGARAGRARGRVVGVPRGPLRTTGGSYRTAPAYASGCATRASSATTAPEEWPTMTHGVPKVAVRAARSSTSRAKSVVGSASSSSLYRRRRILDTWKSRASSAATLAHGDSSVMPPWA